jgi:hypothetical protein
MTTNGADEDYSSITTTGPYGKNTSTTNTTVSDETIIIIVISVCAIVFLMAAFVCYKVTKRWRKSRNTHRHLDESERCDLYQNSGIIRDRLTDNYLETVVNRPLPHPPEMNRESAGKPAVPEDDYERPIPVDSHWLRHLEELRQLPPAPPVFPRDLERLPLEGEGAYTPVIPDDEAPLLSPGRMHDITHDQYLRELSEESGYMVPNSPIQTSLQQNVSETDHSTGPSKMKHRGNEYQITARAVVTPQGAQQQCPNTSKRRSVSESAAISSATQNETEESKDTKGTIYRSTCQLYLSPPTQHRKLPVSVSKPTVVVCIHTDL